jgi:hypothetical protein
MYHILETTDYPLMTIVEKLAHACQILCFWSTPRRQGEGEHGAAVSHPHGWL